MKSRCVEIMKLADSTYDQYKYYGKVDSRSILERLKIQREFVENDLLLSDEEKGDMDMYITTYIAELYYDKASSK